MKDGKSSKDKGYSLRDWFKGGGWKQTGGKYDGKPCAKQPGQTTKPYCRDPDDRAAMSKDERDKRAAKKRREDPNPDRTGKAKIVTQEETKKDACYKKVKASAKVWPSAYASGRLVQCRKKGAANYGNKSEEWVAQTAAEYLFNEGLNEDGVAIFIEELGLESFVEFVYDLGEEVLTEAKFDRLPPVTKTGKKISDLKGGAKASSIKSKRQIRATLRQKVDDESKSKPGFASFSKKASKVTSQSKKDNASKAVASAKKQQPKKKGILDRVAGEVLKGMERHKKAMAAARETGKTISKAAKVGAKGAQEFGKGFKSGVETAGKVAKVAKKAVSENYQFSDWREDFKAMEYEFIDIIEAEPLVTEASFEINPQKHREEVKAKKIRDRTKTGDEGSEIAKKKVRGPKLMGEEVESIDELKCWKGYKRKKGAVPGAKGSCVKESEQIDEIAPVVAGVAGRLAAGAVTRGIGSLATSPLKRKLAQKVGQRVGDTVSNRLSSEEFVDEAKDETEIGITGQPIPKKKRSPKKQYEFEKKRRENLGRNVGGKTYSADVAPYKTNPRIGYVRNEENEIDEAKHTPTKSDLEANIGGGNLQKLSKKASKRIDYDVDGDVDPNDKVEKKTGEYGEELPTPFGKFRTGDSKKVKVKKEEVSNWRDDLEESAAWTKKSGKSESGGLNEKGRKSYERENPGSDLKAPSKKVGNPRRKSFCARMKGMKKKLTSKKTARDPDSRINKSLRAWNC